MEAVYKKLFDKYQKLKVERFTEIDKTTHDLELNLAEFVSAAEGLLEQMTLENHSLKEQMAELRQEVQTLRSSHDDTHELLIEEKRKNQQLSAEIEQLHNLQHEGLSSSSRSGQHKDQLVINNQHTPEISDTPRRTTRKRYTRSSMSHPATNSSSVSSHVELSTPRKLSSRRSTRVAPDVHAPQPDCCQSITKSRDPCKCLFQGLLECLTGMKMSIERRSEGRCIRATHQSSGYSFSLIGLDKAADSGGQLLYNVSSLGTFTKVAPEWMREPIIFSMNMCPVFFQKLFFILVNDDHYNSARALFEQGRSQGG